MLDDRERDLLNRARLTPPRITASTPDAHAQKWAVFVLGFLAVAFVLGVVKMVEIAGMRIDLIASMIVGGTNAN